MIVSKSRNFIFIHISKTGGNAVAEGLRPIVDLTQDYDNQIAYASEEDRPYAGLNRDLKFGLHTNATRARNGVGAEAYRSAFRFAFVRNPFARVYSGFRWLQAEAKKNENNPDYLDRNRKFAEQSFDEMIADIGDLKTGNLALRPQTFWLPQPGMMSYMGRTEHFNQDMQRIWRYLAPDLPEPASFEKVNVSTRPDQWRNMSGTARDQIVTHYADDFERFGYPTDLDAALPDAYPLEFAHSNGVVVPRIFRI